MNLWSKTVHVPPRTTATPEVTHDTSTDHPPVRETQREMLQGRGSANEAEMEQGAMTGQRVMRAIRGWEN